MQRQQSGRSLSSSGHFSLSLMRYGQATSPTVESTMRSGGTARPTTAVEVRLLQRPSSLRSRTSHGGVGHLQLDAEHPSPRSHLERGSDKIRSPRLWMGRFVDQYRRATCPPMASASYAVRRDCPTYDCSRSPTSTTAELTKKSDFSRWCWSPPARRGASVSSLPPGTWER